jgi:hypothetical protein
VKYQQDLQVKLQERYRRLYKAGSNAYEHEARYLCEFIRSVPSLSFLVDAIERSEPDLDPAQWKADHIGWNNFGLPPTEAGRAKLCWFLLNEFAEAGHLSLAVGQAVDAGENNLDALCRSASEAVVEPLIEFLQERIGESSDVLHLLERYVRRVEWFDQARLWDEFNADTRRGEAVYDRDLRRFLFEQGIDYPFSQPRSASGEADVIANLHTDDPLVCEVKLFDGDGYGPAYVGKGVQQAVAYAHDYGETAAYLVIVNLSDKLLELPTDSVTAQWPARLDVGGVTVFLVVVRARPLPSASLRGKGNVLTIQRGSLVNTA